MAAGRIVLPPYFPARDGNGYPVSGADLYVYENETTELTPIYTDFALTLPSPNPVTANASGVFPDVFAEAGTEEDPVLYSLAITDNVGRAPGRPSVFDNYRPSVDYNTATLILAEAASASAQADAAIAAQALADIEAIAAGAPDAPSVANKANINGSNITAPLTFRSAVGLGTANTPQFADVGLGVSPWAGGTSARTVASILLAALVPPITEFGGVGNGTANDSAALVAAFAAGRGVFLPKYLANGAEAAWNFATPVQFPVNAVVLGDYRLTKVKTGTGDMFRLAGGGRICIENLSIDGTAQLVGGVAIKFLTGTSSFTHTRISNIEAAFCYGTIHDENGAGTITDTIIDDVQSIEPRGTPFKFRDMSAFNYLIKCVVDLVPLAGNPAFVSFDIDGGAGLVLIECEVNGYGQGGSPNTGQHAYLIQNQQALWMRDCFGDTTGGWGCRLINCAAAVQDCTFGFNFEGQFYADNCTSLTMTGRLWGQGRKGLTPATAAKSAVVIKNSTQVQMTSGMLQAGTNHTIELESVTNSRISCIAHNATAAGVYVNGCTNVKIDVEATSNGTAGVLVNNSSNIEVNGHFISNGTFGIEETSSANFNRYSGGFNGNPSGNGKLMGARSRAFNYHNAAGAFVLITPAANGDVVTSLVF